MAVLTFSARSSRSAQAGLALPLALAVVAALLALAALIMQQNRRSINPWIRARDKAQAQYLAESGLAWALYQERYAHPAQDKSKDSVTALGSAPDPGVAELFFRLDTGMRKPEVNVKQGSYLEITSKAIHGQDTVSVRARFGRRLDPQIFAAALTWENDSMATPFPASKVNGKVTLKTPTPGIASEPWPTGLSVESYASAFADELYNHAEDELHQALKKEGGAPGNGRFDASHPPAMTPDDPVFRYPLGHLEISGGTFDTLVIKGPAAFFAHGDIRVRGKVRLEDITLSSEADILLEDEVSGNSLSFYARRNITMLGKTAIEVQALAGRNIHLRDEAQVIRHSLLLVRAGSRGAAKADSLCAIRIVQSAKASGFILALGRGSRVVMGGEANRIRGVVLADEAWLAGKIEGSVAVRSLRCGEQKPPRCLGPVFIDRSGLGSEFLQPMRMGSLNPEQNDFQLLSYQWD